VRHGVTSGATKPSVQAGSFCYGFNSTEIVNGVIALSVVQSGFAPLIKGGSISAAIQRAVSGGPTGFAPFLFICHQGTAVGGSAYILGLSDGNPHHIELRKGPLTGGLPDAGVNPTTNPHILMRSTDVFDPGVWHHLRLDAILQGTGDIVLQCFSSDLEANEVNDPNWIVVPGMEGEQAPAIKGFVDDALGINTGSVPHAGGKVGFGFHVTDVTRRAFIDHVEVRQQL
jgi:hypothetical protein